MTEAAPEAVARRFLERMEARDLTGASSLLHPGCLMLFPGGSYRSLEEMVKAAAGRYEWVRKRIAGVDRADAADCSVVYVHGTLYGVNLAGAEFDGIRFIDRFEIVNGRIRRQDVWNDLAESRVLEAV